MTMLRLAATLSARPIALRRLVPDWALVGIAASAALLPQLVRTGPEMDEGLVLSYAERVLHGAVPYRDFPYYGPGNLWSIAGAFAVFGVRQSVERAVGLLYVIATILVIYLLVRRVSNRAAIASVVMTVAISMSVGVWAYVTRPATAFILFSILVATANERADSGRDRLRFALAGLLAGCSLLYRWDFIVVVLPAAIVLVARMDRRGRRPYVTALAASLLLYVPYIVLSGRAGLHRAVREFTAASGGQSRLPLPSPLFVPTGALLFGSALALCVLAAAAVLLWRRSPNSVQLAAVTAASVGSVPLMLTRADDTHVAPTALLVFGFLPMAVVELTRQLRASSVGLRVVQLVTAVSVVWGVGILISVGLLADTASMLRGSVYRGAVVRSEGRTFILAQQQDAAHAQRVLSAVDRLSHRGQSVFVGPSDLRRAVYGPTYMYYLLPQLRPASYYTVFNPGVINGPHSTLAHDLLGADWLILVSKWDKIHEPNGTLVGSDAPNQVVRTKFCMRLRVGAYHLYESRRLDAGGCAA